MPFDNTDALTFLWFVAMLVLATAFLRAVQLALPDDSPTAKALAAIAW